MQYSSKWSNEYSMVLLESAFVHRHHLSRLPSVVSPAVAADLGALEGLDDDDATCADVVVNFVVADAVGRPPVKVAQRRSLVGTKNARWARNSSL